MPINPKVLAEHQRLYDATVKTTQRLVLEKPIPGAQLGFRANDRDFTEDGIGVVRTLTAFDLSRTQDYTYVPEPKRFHPDLPIGPTFVGEIHARINPRKAVIPGECYDDYMALREASQRAGFLEGKTWVVMWSYVCFDEDDRRPPYCTDSYRNKKVGAALYRALVQSISTPNAVAYLVADACIGSTTSPEARRVYPSLVREYAGNGLVVTSVPKASPAGKALTREVDAVKAQAAILHAKTVASAITVRRRSK